VVLEGFAAFGMQTRGDPVCRFDDRCLQLAKHSRDLADAPGQPHMAARAVAPTSIPELARRARLLNTVLERPQSVQCRAVDACVHVSDNIPSVVIASDHLRTRIDVAQGGDSHFRSNEPASPWTGQSSLKMREDLVVKWLDPQCAPGPKQVRPRIHRFAKLYSK